MSINYLILVEKDIFFCFREVYNRNKLPHAVEISPISWLFHFPDNAKDVVPDTENRSEGETMLEQYKKLPETEKKYHFVSVRFKRVLYQVEMRL